MSHLQDLRANPQNRPVMAAANILSSASMSSTGAVAGFAALGARTYQTYEGWRPSGGTGRLTATASGSITYVGALFVSAPTNAKVQLFVNGARRGWSMPASGACLWLLDSVSASSVALDVSGLSTGHVANIMAGVRTELERNIYVGHTPITLGRNVQRVQGVSERGQYLGTIIRRRTLGTSVSMSNITPAYYRDTIDPTLRLLERQPMYFSWRQWIEAGGSLLTEEGFGLLTEDREPIGYTVASPYDEIGYAWMDGDPAIANERANGMMSMSMGLSGMDGRL